MSFNSTGIRSSSHKGTIFQMTWNCHHSCTLSPNLHWENYCAGRLARVPMGILRRWGDLILSAVCVCSLSQDKSLE